MLRKIASRIYGKLKHLAFPPDPFLSECRSIIHVGANRGEERIAYASHDLSVLWVEALPHVFRELRNNLSDFPKQTAVEALVTDQEGNTCDFKVSDHGGVSSSIFEFGGHAELWPDVKMTNTIQLVSTTLARLIKDANRSPNEFDALIMDVQGAELLVLKGAGELLEHVRFIEAEASDFEAYIGACTLDSLSAFLAQKGFRIRRKERFASKRAVGSYFNVLYEKRPLKR
jgi:FkbM family methyltransferase